MKKIWERLEESRTYIEEQSKPVIFRPGNSGDENTLESILLQQPRVMVVDTIYNQLKDLIKLEHPERTLTEEEYQVLIGNKLAGKSTAEYGVYVYYPWRNMVVHMLDEEEFIRVRTIRNAYKITFEEQAILRSKKVGIIGLSVGQSVAMTLAIERGAGEIRIADFDTLELSNLNRIRLGVHNIGIRKTTAVAREIAEIDPFIKITCYDEGITKSNIRDFLEKDGKLDLLIEECDSVDIKILAREEAKKLKIPVIMDTSDRGMLDIERFDLDPAYPLLHGLVDPAVTYDFLSTLKTSEEKLPYIVPILGAENLSVRLKASGLEVGKTLTTWPQLGSDVVLGGALCANASRRILLGENLVSGRNYVDLDELIESEKPQKQEAIEYEKLLSKKDILDLIKNQKPGNTTIDQPTIEKILEAATLAPSPGNKQQWKWLFKEGALYLFIDKQKPYAYGDNIEISSTIAAGCALENIRQYCSSVGLHPTIEIHDPIEFSPLVARIEFEKQTFASTEENYAEYIQKRQTYRSNKSTPIDLEPIINKSKALSSDTMLLGVADNREEIKKISNLICRADRIRFTNIQGHQEFFNHEIRWNKQEAAKHGDGLDLSLFDLKVRDITGLKLSQDVEVIRFLNKISGGGGFEKISESTFETASGIGYIVCKDFSRKSLIEAGSRLENLWLWATKNNYGIYPVTVLPMLLSFNHLDKHQFNSPETLNKLNEIQNELSQIINPMKDMKLTFMYRIASAIPNPHRSVRKPVSDKLLIL